MSSGSERERRAERLATGIPGLDVILNGGLLRGSIYIVQGTPGTGKTILATQICFAEIAEGRRALYVTLLAESHARMMSNLRPLTFYDDSKVPDALYYVSAFSALEQEGLRGVLDVVRREIRARHASLLIIDGLVPVEEAAKSQLELKKFVHELQVQGELGRCTTLLLTSGTRQPLGPERTMVDGLMELSDPLFGSNRERRLEMTKFRGSRCLRGQHAFEITDGGIVVHPRVEAMLPRPSQTQPPAGAPISTGCRGLDQVLRGGYPAGSTTMLLGPSGAGKTSLGLHFLSACSPRAPGVYLSFYETQVRAAMKASKLGLPLERLLDDGSVRFLWMPTTENILDAVGGRLLEVAGQQGAQRIFIDGMDGFLEVATDPSRVVRVLTALANEFRSRDICTVCTAESRDIVAERLEAPPTGVSTMIDNLILLRYAELESRLSRLISVLKVRDSDFDSAVREVVFTDAGLLVKEPFKGWENLVGGSARKHREGAR